MKLKREPVARAAVALIILAGVAWTIINGLQAENLTGKIKDKLETLTQLQAMQRQQLLIEAAFNALGAVSNHAPALSVLASGAITGAAPEIRDLETRSLERGWTVKKTQVVFKDVNLNDLQGFLRSSETQHPPWRLAGCVIAASSQADGFGNAALTMETLVPQSSGNTRTNSVLSGNAEKESLGGPFCN